MLAATWPLIGRDTTLESIRPALAATAAGAGGWGCVVVEGPAGIGKTRLLEAVAAEAAELGVALAFGRASELDRVAPLTSLLTTLQSTDPPDLGLRELTTSDANRFQLIDRIGDAVERYARTRPLLMILDDAHWADEVSALALRILVPYFASSPVLWLLARRQTPRPAPAQDAIDWLIDEGAQRVELDPLPKAAVADLCAQVLGALPDETVMALAARSGGNPFLVLQLVTALQDTCQMRVCEGTATLVGDALPSSFLAAVRQRLRGLSPDARRMLEVGSVLKRPFTVHAAARMMGRSAAELLTTADETLGGGLLVDRGFELAFQHDLLAEAVYNNLAGPVRSALHREAAEVARAENRPPMEIAEHLVRSGRPGTGEALEMLRDAATQVATHTPGTAADLILRALELVSEHDPARPALTADAVRLLASAGRLVEAGQLGETALHSGLDAATEAALRLGLAEALKHAGHNALVVHHTERALARSEVPEPLVARLLALQAHALVFDDPDRADRVAADAVSLGAEVGEHTASVFAGVARSVVARIRGNLEEAVEHAEWATGLADRVGGEAHHRHPRLWLGCALATLDRFDEAEAMYTTGQREAQQMGTAWSQPLWHFYRASLLLGAGHLADAETEAEAGVRIAEQLTALQMSIPLLTIIAQVAIRRAQVTVARNHLQRAQQLLADGITVAREDLTWSMAQLRDLTGETAATRDLLGELCEVLPDRKLLLANDPGAGPALVRIALRACAAEHAKTATVTMRQLADRSPSVASLAGAAAHAEGLLYQDVDALREAVLYYRHSPRPLASASAIEDLAVAEYLAGRRHQGVELLDEAIGLYRACGAQLDVARVYKRLRTFGVRRVAVAEPGSENCWGSLTQSELRVVRLVAEGLTNRDVADRLYLSPHTVDSHLRHVFTKLGVRSRVELTRKFVAEDGIGQDAA